MNRGEIVTLVAQRLGSRTDLAVEIATNIKWVQENELEGCKEFLAWFLLSPTFSVTVAAGANSAALTGLLRPDDEAIFRMYPSATTTSVTELTRRNFDRGVGHLLADTSRPLQVSIFHNILYVDRKADEEYVVFFPAFVREVALDADATTNAWTEKASDWLVAEVVKKLALRLVNTKLYAAASAEAATAKARVWTQSEAFLHAGQDYVMGVGRERD